MTCMRKVLTVELERHVLRLCLQNFHFVRLSSLILLVTAWVRR